MPSKITLESLAAMVKQGFDQVGGEFGRVYERFDRVDREISDIKLRLDQAAYRFELVELGRRAGTLEKNVGIGKH